MRHHRIFLISNSNEEKVLWAMLTSTGHPFMACTWLSELCSCCCYTLLPYLACKILAITHRPWRGAQQRYLFFTKWCHNNRQLLHIWPPYLPGPGAVCSSVPRCEQLVQWLDIWATNREWRGFRSLLPKGDKSRAISSASKWGERDSTEGGRRISAPEPWRPTVHCRSVALIQW